MPNPNDDVRPVHGDTKGFLVGQRLVSLAGKAWFASDGGDYQTYAVEARNKATGTWDLLVALEWPGRVIGTEDRSTVRMLIHPEDAAGLAEVLAHTARWAAEHKKLMEQSPGAGKHDPR